MIHLKNKSEIEKLYSAGQIVKDTLFLVEEHIKPGITTLELDTIAERYIRSKNAIPGFKGLYGFPGTLCVSIDNEVVHGIPSERVLKKGEIISIDVGSIYQDFYGDHAKTFAIGNINKDRKKILDVTKQSLMLAIDQVSSGKFIGDIGYAVQNYAEKHNFSVVKDLVGHGIGKSLHEEPQIPNYGQMNTGAKIKEGMCLAIEPMLNQGSDKIITKEDGWTVCTLDGKLSAHFEHTVVVTKKGVEILTI